MGTAGMTFHRHRCPKCKTIWRHADRGSGSMTPRDHHCPKCGAERFWKYDPKRYGYDGYTERQSRLRRGSV